MNVDLEKLSPEHIKFLLVGALEQHYWERLSNDLDKPRSLTYQFIKDKMKEQGHWKAKGRGKPQKKEVLQRPLTTVDIHKVEGQQVEYNPDEFSDGL